MTATVDGKTFEGETPRDCYVAARAALDHEGMTIKECKAIKEQVLKSLGVEDWHPQPVVIVKAKGG